MENNIAELLSKSNSFSWCMVFNTTFNNISAISWQSVLSVEKTGIPGENYFIT